MKEFNLICCGCNVDYMSKYRPKNNVWYCSKSCANRHNPRREMEGKCHVCGTKISASRKYCNYCLKTLRDSKKIESVSNKKTYLRKAVKSYCRRLKQSAINYKGGCCQICGYKKYNGSMQFHHINDSEKLFSISGKSMSFDRLKPELDKCLLVCANCHGEIHGGLIDIKLVRPDGTAPSPIG